MVRIIFEVETTATGFSGSVVTPAEGLPILVTAETFLDFQKEAEEALAFQTEEETDGEPDFYHDIRNGDYELFYRLPIRDFLNAYSAVMGQSGLSEITGISNAQFWRYQHGDVTPRPKQKTKIEEALHAFGDSLKRIQII